MAQVNLDFHDKNVAEKGDQATTVVTACTGNAIMSSADAVAAVAAVQFAAYTLNISALAAMAADDAAKEAHSQQDEDEALLDAAYSALGGIVQTKSGGDATDILSTGFAVRSSSHVSLPLTAPQHVSVTMGDMAGVLDVSCDADKAATAGFLPQFTTDLTGATGWQNGIVSKASHMKIGGLVSGTKYLVRVAMIGGKQALGPWSDAVTKMAP